MALAESDTMIHAVDEFGDNVNGIEFLLQDGFRDAYRERQRLIRARGADGGQQFA